MSYLEKNLGKGEQVIYCAKVSKWCLLRDVILSIIFIGIPLLIIDLIRIGTTELGFTNKRLIGKKGLIRTIVMDSPLNKVQNVAVQSGLFGKIFGYGVISITTASGSYYFTPIAQADNLRSALMQAIDNAEQERINKQAEAIARATQGAGFDVK